MKLVIGLLSLLSVAGLVAAASTGARVNVRMIDSDKVFQLAFASSDDVASLKEKIKSNWNVPLENQTLFLAPNYVPLDEGHTLGEFKVGNNDNVWVYVERTNEKKLFVRMIGGTSEIIELPFDQSETVAWVKSNVETRWKIPVAEQTLYVGGFENQVEMKDDASRLENFKLVGNIKPDIDSTIWVYAPQKKEEQIFIRRIGGSSLQVVALPYDGAQSVASIKAKISEELSVPVEEQTLLYGPNHIPMDDERSIADYKVPAEFTIHPASTIWLEVRRENQQKIFVRRIGGATSVLVELPYNQNESIQSIKSKLEAQLNVPADRQTLYYGPNHIPMEDARSLADYKVPGESNVQPSSTIWLFASSS